jgi:hypothetical protein
MPRPDQVRPSSVRGASSGRPPGHPPARSRLIGPGESPAYVRDQMGRHSIKITVDRCGHPVPGATEAAVPSVPGWMRQSLPPKLL